MPTASSPSAHRLHEAPLVPATGLRWYLAAEFALLFVGLPLLLYTQRMHLDGLIAPILMGLALGCGALLYYDRSFDRTRLWNRAAARSHLGTVGRFFLAGGALTVLIVAALRPDLLLSFPREHPRLWLIIVCTYPVVSVYPQEVIFRAFLFHRYDALFPQRATKIAVSGVAFGLAHIVFANWTAPLMTAVSGWVLGYRYTRSHSTLLVTVEHGLWGAFAFTIGLGWYVYSGAIG
ncbi:CPBP family intramembrane glutamic endopeptidase [Salisaeta longa]|uniref:CPBP family intramembrane glutamic endopeptidase n=1 Tax=Salisaeta longa TaxID=503170 RepID=UPI000A000AF4|nr:CPBP family intramembrane glutamic endopeptidase [Salisaeta longa]